MKDVQGYICSYRKSGRTWLRFTLAAYLLELNKIPFDLSLQNVYQVTPNLDPPRPGTERSVFLFEDNANCPLFLCSHRPYDADLFSQARIIFIYRNPLDILVSHYFYKTRHERSEISELPDFVIEGVNSLSDYLNSWAKPITQSNVLTVSYENLRADTILAFQAIIKHLGLPEDKDSIIKAVEYASFDNMLSKEIKSGILGFDYNRDDPDARRVRRGIIGGYRDYLTPELIDFIINALSKNLVDSVLALNQDYLNEARSLLES
jgi:alcohol sulfotransferase